MPKPRRTLLSGTLRVPKLPRNIRAALIRIAAAAASNPGARVTVLAIDALVRRGSSLGAK